MRTVLPLLAALTLMLPAVAGAHPCESQAHLQAQRLLRLHLGLGERDAVDEQITIGTRVHALAQVKNPADDRQRLDVLELWAYKGKGEFRIRLLYMKGDTAECIPVGQEIVNWATY